jgi:hypothetical protein
MQLANAWEFEDFSDEALLQYLLKAVRQRGLTISMETAIAAVGVLAKKRMRPKFGNAGDVNNLLSDACLRMEARLRSLPPAQRARVTELSAEDFGGGSGTPGTGPEEIFADLVGCSTLIGRLREYQATIKVAQDMGHDPCRRWTCVSSSSAPRGPARRPWPGGWASCSTR